MVVKSIGPRMRLAALAAAHSPAASSSARATSGSSAVSKKPNIASLPPWYSSQRLVDLGADPPDRLAVALGEEELHLAVLEVGVLLAVEELHPLEDQRRHPLRVVAVEAERDLDEALPLAPASAPAGSTRFPSGPQPTLWAMSETAKAPVDVFEKARSHDRLEQLEAAKEHDLLPYFRLLTSQAGPVVEMEGRETIMLGSNNYLGLTGDERVKEAAREALETYGTGVTGSRLLNGTTPLHVDLERELAEWMRTEDAIVFTTGYQSNVGCIGTILGPADTVICDSGDHASILDGCRLSGAKLRPFRHNRMDKLEKMLQRAAGGRRRRPRRRRRRLLDGGRRLRPAAHRRALQGLRRAADGRRGPRRRRPRRPRRRRLRALRPRGRGRPADGHLLQEPRLLRRLHRRPGRRDRVPADLLALLHLQRLGGAGRGRRGAGGAAGDPRGRARSCSSACSPTPSTCARACATSA